VKRIILRNVPADVRTLISETAVAEKVDEATAAIKLLVNVAVEHAVEHDIAVIRSWVDDHQSTGERQTAACHHCCCHRS